MPYRVFKAAKRRRFAEWSAVFRACLLVTEMGANVKHILALLQVQIPDKEPETVVPTGSRAQNT